MVWFMYNISSAIVHPTSSTAHPLNMTMKSVALLALLALDAPPAYCRSRTNRRRHRDRTKTKYPPHRLAAETTPGCYPTHREGSEYFENSLVSAAKTIASTEDCSDDNDTGCTTRTFNYQCVQGAFSAFCSMLGYDPAGVHGMIAWNELSACEVRVIVCVYCHSRHVLFYYLCWSNVECTLSSVFSLLQP